MVQVCHSEIEWHTLWPGLEPVYRGHAGIRAWGNAILEIFENPGSEVVEVVDVDDHRAVLHLRVYGQGRGSGTPTDMHVYDVWTFDDGLLRERLTFYEREQAEKAAGLR